MEQVAVHVGAGFKPAPTGQHQCPTTLAHAAAPLRLSGYDYSQTGAYFITASTQKRVVLFGEIIDCNMRLNETGTIVQQTWEDLPTHYHGIDLDAFMVMPNHMRSEE